LFKDESSGKGGNTGNDVGLKKGSTLNLNPCCSHCRNVTVHKLLDLGPTKKVCFFLKLPQTKARKAASNSLIMLHQTGAGSLHTICVRLGEPCQKKQTIKYNPILVSHSEFFDCL
jgi:hypothetical protein